MLNYQTHIDGGSMFNTSGCSYLCGIADIALDKGSGRCEGNGTSRHRKADMLYAEIDRNKMFVGTAKEDRSRMNICFVMAPEYKEFGTGSRLPEIRYRKGYGRYQGTPFRRRFPRILLQCHAEGKRTGFDRLHAGI